MTEEKYTAEQLEQMADQLLQEAAPAQDKPAKGGLDEKTIASLPAAALLNGNEKRSGRRGCSGSGNPPARRCSSTAFPTPS